MTKVDAILYRDGLTLSKNWQDAHSGRWIKVFSDGTDFVLVAGYEGLPYDYKEQHESVDDLLASMRALETDFRRWVFSSY